MKRTARSTASFLALLAASGLALAGALDAISQKDAVAGLRSALTVSAQKAVSRLGVTDGFLGDPEVKIPLPGRLQDAEKTLRRFGFGAQADELITAMNRAAEAAVPEAKPLLIDAVKKMTLEDAKGILTGGDDAATQYFRRTTSAQLTQRFLPIVTKATAKVDLAQRYDALAGRLGSLGVLHGDQASLESYVTAKTLDGLFLVMAREEAAIRKDPLGQASRLLQRVFGAARN
jgi:hypothetical protein